MTRIDCPHQEEDERTCTGCTQDPGSDPGIVQCNGEITGHVYRDSEGDSGVIGGNHSFWAVEDVEPTCKCQLTPAEFESAQERLVDELRD